jgi:hypothetical protein
VVEASGGLVWREATQGIRLKDVPEWVRFYNATKRAAALAATSAREGES